MDDGDNQEGSSSPELLDEFKENLLSEETRWVYQKYLLGHDIWYFRDHLSIETFADFYHDLKLYMSSKLGIHLNNIAIVGSAKLGFSLSPSTEKMFAPFNYSSDLDVVVVSSDLFNKSWKAFESLNRRGFLPSYNHVAKEIFRRFVTLKKPDHRDDFFRFWNGKVEPCLKDLQTLFSIDHDINYRIYESWEAVENYHCLGLEKLKDLIEGSEK